MKQLLGLLLIFAANAVNAQNADKKKVTPVAFDGLMVVALTKSATYVNFGGPGLRITHKKFSTTIGVLPSMRFKKTITNTNPNLMQPTAGVGITVVNKHLVLQTQLYYNNASKKWEPGLGLGFKIYK